MCLDKTEKWTEAKYSISELDQPTIESWCTANVENLKLPERNRFLAENFEIKESEPSRDWIFPQKVFEEKRGELWFKSDKIFNLPRGIVAILMRSGATQETARTSSMTAFLASVLGRLLDKEISEAGMASIDCRRRFLDSRDVRTKVGP